MSHNIAAHHRRTTYADCPETIKSNPLRVLHVDNIIGETSAALNEHVLPMADKYEISLCTFFPSTIDVPPSVRFFAGQGTIVSFYRNLMDCMRASRYDVIHIHAPHVGLFTLAFMLLGRFNLLKSTVYTVHSCYQYYTPFHRLLMLFLFGFYGRIVHCSWSSYHSFPMLYRWLAGSRRTAIPNGVDVERIDLVIGDGVGRGPRPDMEGHPRILSIGRLVPIKNLFTLMDSVANADLPNATLEFLGDGELRESLQAAVSQSGLNEQFVLRGMIQRDQVYREVADADLYVSTSLGEGLPIAVMEAMCCRCPVILSDIPPHRELAESVDFIPLIDPSDSAGFAQEIRRLLDMSRAERMQLGEKARKLVVEHFSLEAMHEGYATLYACT